LQAKENAVSSPLTGPVVSVPTPPPPTIAPDYHDRSTGLIIFGIIQIVLGLFCALFIPFTLLSVYIARKSPMGAMPAGYYVLTISTYAAMSVVLITLGIGSIRKQRWARDLTLIASWMWLIYGSVTLIMMTIILPSSMMAGMRAAAASNPRAGGLPAGIGAVIATLMLAFMAVFMVVLPIIFLVFYKKKDVQETCKRYDPILRWTERVPLPVLAGSILYAIGALHSLLSSFTIPIVPFFGRYLTGFPAAGAFLLTCAINAALAVLFYRKAIAGWWGAIAMILLQGVSIAFTIGRGNMLEAYARSGWSSQQLQLLQSNPMYRSGGFLWFAIFAMLIFLGYLIWVKRYFVDEPAPQAPVADIYQNPLAP
jgi:hypothetical protein